MGNRTKAGHLAGLRNYLTNGELGSFNSLLEFRFGTHKAVSHTVDTGNPTRILGGVSQLLAQTLYVLLYQSGTVCLVAPNGAFQSLVGNDAAPVLYQ